MATTTNYGWTTPDDTALVKDGAAAIRSLGSAVDTTMFTMVPKTIVDAKGDIIAATAADTVSRLAVGANDTVLMADSTTATGLKWGTIAAGAMTLLSTTTLSGASTTISSISQSYKHLFILIDGVNIATSAGALTIKPNNTTTYYTGITGVSGTPTTYATTNSITGTNWDFGSTQNKIAYWVYDYTNANSPSPGHKAVSFSGVYVPGAQGYFQGGGGVATGSAITSMYFSVPTSFNGGTVRIYGVS